MHSGVHMSKHLNIGIQTPYSCPLNYSLMGSEDCHCTQQVTGSTLSLTNLTLKNKRSTSVYEAQATRAFPLWSVICKLSSAERYEIWKTEKIKYRPWYSRSSRCASFWTRALFTHKAAMSPLHHLRPPRCQSFKVPRTMLQISKWAMNVAKQQSLNLQEKRTPKKKIKLDLIIISNDVFCSLYMNKQINTKPKGTLWAGSFLWRVLLYFICKFLTPHTILKSPHEASADLQTMLHNFPYQL